MTVNGADSLRARASAFSRRSLLAGAGGAALAGLLPHQPALGVVPHAAPSADRLAASVSSRDDIVAEFTGRGPAMFGMFLPGVATCGRRHIALTFDACGGSGLGSGFDAKVIRVLIRHRARATLFLNGRWIQANPGIAADLAANPLFELANHGWAHRPLTVAGQQVYGVAGSASPGEAYDEIVRGQEALAAVTGRISALFRPGTAWCDDVGVAIATRLGVRVISFGINADAGATASAKTVVANLMKARKRTIAIAHFNRPERATAEGLAKALPRMLDAGRTFTTLSGALA